MLKRFLIFCLLIISVFTANADVFIVTNNADAGPGTLREALTLAANNGSAVKDYINFNIPDLSEAGRTITVATQLPQISSNIEIDGTTQPGSKIGLSDAGITIKSLRSQTALTVLTANGANHISIYGIFFLDSTNDCISDPDGAFKTGISLKNCSYFTFGKAGKGNIVNGYKYTSIDIESCDHIIFAGNIFGVSPYSYENVCSGSITIRKSNFIDVGTAGQGNIFFSWIRIELDDTNDIQCIINVVDNNFAVMADGKTTLHTADGTYIQLVGIPANPSDPFPNALINIEGNLISHFGQFGGITLGHLGGKINIKHNWFGTDRTATEPLNMRRAHPGDGYALYFDDIKADIVIGDDDPAMANKIAYAYYGILANNVQNLYLLRNSFKCIGGKEYFNYDTTLPKIVVTKTTSQYISGKTEPMALVDVFTSDDCVNCSPETYIGSTNADATGNWKYNFSQVYTKSIIANAHIGKRSTNFTKPEIDISHINIINFDCGVNGKITGVIVNNTEIFKWVDEQGNIVSTNLNLEGVPPGNYKLIVGKYCTVESGFLTIGDLRPQIIDWSKMIVNPSCGTNGGAIKGIFAYTINSQPITYSWIDENSVPVGNTADLTNVGPGKYIMIAKTATGCESRYGPIILSAKGAPSINEANKIITATNCNTSSGSITGITVNATNPKPIWKNENQIEVGQSLDLINQPPGKYTLTVTDDSDCGPVTTEQIIIPAINDVAINETNKIVQKAHCDNYDGAISGITITGTGSLTYLWTNEQGTDVGHNKDLAGVPAGKYKLTVSGTNCPPVFTDFIDILEVNGITIDDSQKIISMATCQYDNGGISNIQVTGATTYTWYNTSNVSVSNNLDLTGMPTGDYYLIAANDNGCTKQTAAYSITRQPPVSYGGLTKTLKNATCDENNGSIEVIFQDAPAVLPGSYKWVNTATGQITTTSTPVLTGIDAGTYAVYGVTNGCEQYLINYSIGRNPGLAVVTDFLHKNDDNCSTGTGSIVGVKASGTTPLKFTWTDDNGAYKGADADLLNIPAGTYHLKITDGSDCEQGFVYTIYDKFDNLPPPNVSDVQLCSPGKAIISVSHPESRYRYRLFKDNSITTPIDDQQSGKFWVNINANATYYISQYIGACESTRAEVKVTLSGISATDIANTFTPNGDGFNDYWAIKGMENYTNGTVKVFTRDGRMVYQSKGYAVPFDGTFNGKPLPTGVYYYIIDLKSCSILTGNLTIVR